eukprot:TRINITY_DN82740_c0_g1_i1.p1 TRINITY_DN82740_c0_g1~~TRINITY_DN82740_c0_g1_i1.p1  ORF type:complete len:532 (+),score=125.57 TRINITY_DN82740_c0_g1_i1:123-1718(+)
MSSEEEAVVNLENDKAETPKNPAPEPEEPVSVSEPVYPPVEQQGQDVESHENVEVHVAEEMEENQDKELAEEEPQPIPIVEEEKKEKNKITLDGTTIAFAIVQLVLIILFLLFTDYAPFSTTEQQTAVSSSIDSEYSFLIGVTIMVFVGFGYLMTFLRRYGFSAVGFTLLLSSIIVEWGILNMAFWERVKHDHWTTLDLSTKWLIEGDFAAATFLISFGALIGKVSILQLLITGMVEIVFYAFNFYLISHELEAADVGGSMAIHTFGAFFGLAVSYMLCRPAKKQASEDNSSRYTSDLFAFIGSIFLWIYWPSFNGAFAGTGSNRVAVNTMLSLIGSTVTTFICSRIFRVKGKYNMVDVANATLAGGVAIGSSANLNIGPGFAIITGSIAGIISTFGFGVLSEMLQVVLGLTDTCGVHNLHGLPGVLGGLVSIVVAGFAKESSYGKAEYDALFAHGSDQAGYQFFALLITLGVAIVSGLFTGYILKTFTTSETESLEGKKFRDDVYWELEVGEYTKIPYDEEEADRLMKRN